MQFLLYLLFSFSIILASLRGALVLHLGFDPPSLYTFSSFSLIACGVTFVVFFCRRKRYSVHGVSHGLLVKLATSFSLFFLVYAILLGRPEPGPLYIAWVLPVAFFYASYSAALIEPIVAIIHLGTFFGVLYLASLSMNNISVAYTVQEILRPGEDSISHIGGSIVQYGGYQADHHDASNILVMTTIYFLVSTYFARGLKRLVLIPFVVAGFVGVLLCASATNTVVLLASTILFIISLISSANITGKVFFVVGFLALFASLLYVDANLHPLFHVSEKFAMSQADLEKGGMYNSLDFFSLLYSIPAFLFGFGTLLGAPVSYSEISFLKLISGYGLLPSIWLFSILLLPLSILLAFPRTPAWLRTIGFARILPISVSSSSSKKLFLYALPVFAGVLTLLHYGSLLRVTSVGLFALLLGSFIGQYKLVYQKDTARLTQVF